MALKGREDILKNLKRQNSLLLKGVSAGLVDSASFIERESNKLAPKDSGFMREQSSFTTKMTKKGTAIVGRVGYDAEYAAYVHEMPETNNFTTPGTGPKFLERAAKNNRNRALDIFYKAVRRYIAAWK